MRRYCDKLTWLVEKASTKQARSDAARNSNCSGLLIASVYAKTGLECPPLEDLSHRLILEQTTMIEQFIDNFVRKSDVFSALKRANVACILIDIPQRSFLMLEAA